MCWEFCNAKYVTTRKEHKCANCRRIIPAKSNTIWSSSGKWDGEMVSGHYCHWCDEHSNNFNDDDYAIDFWDGIYDIFYDKRRELEKLTEDECVEMELEEDYLIFEDSDGKEIHREYIPVIKESEDE